MAPHELNIDSPVFAGALLMLGDKITETIKDMIAKNLSIGQVDLKIEIGVMQAPDEDGVFHNTVIFDPKVTRKIGSTEKTKCGGSGGRIEINKDGQIIIGTNQISMDELLEEQKGA